MEQQKTVIGELQQAVQNCKQTEVSARQNAGVLGWTRNPCSSRQVNGVHHV